MSRSTWVIAGTVLLALALIALFIVLLLRDAPEAVPVETPSVEAETPVYRHPLTGEALAEPLAQLPQVFGIMIENSADAWPLAGLEQAFLVIEAPVEGAIPRFITFYSAEQDVTKIGPVRSARPYYLDWNDELDAVYGHVGGSNEALELLRSYGTIDLDEFFQGEYFYRDNRTRYAPHNAYTTMNDLRDALDELALDIPKYGAWTFKDTDIDEASELSFDIDWTSGSTYDVRWEYGALTHDYQRRQGGANSAVANYIDLAEGGDIIANNVIMMETNISVIDGVGRRHIETIGEGRAYVAQDGKMINATWKKQSRTDRLRFYDEQGNEIALNAGKTWIEVLSSLSQVTILSSL